MTDDDAGGRGEGGYKYNFLDDVICGRPLIMLDL